MGTNKSVGTEPKPKTPGMSEMVSEARLRLLIEEEEQIAKSDSEVMGLKIYTNELLGRMEAAKLANDEVLRREIRNEVIVKNLRLVTQVLKKYGFFNQDKFQTGCIGLLKAAETFDSAKEVPFGNYAAFCIETEIRFAFKKQNRMFESKKQGFLTHLDSTTSRGGEDKSVEIHESVADPIAAEDFDELINEAEVDTLFYDIIIPCIEEYGQRSKNVDMSLWRKLELQYFIELSTEDSQKQRLTLKEMSRQLDTPMMNIRSKHKKVMELIRIKCRELGYNIAISSNGRARVVHNPVKTSAIIGQRDD